MKKKNEQRGRGMVEVRLRGRVPRGVAGLKKRKKKRVMKSE